MDFWEDNTAQTVQERFLNDFAIKSLELVSKGKIPQYNVSPSSPLSKILSSFTKLGLRSRFTDLEELLEAHIDSSELEAWGPLTQSPILILGACNVLTGKLHKFNSYHEPIKVEHILASACVPNLFPAVSIETMAYWDGLFSDNPPIRTLIRGAFVGVENIPHEIWVIKINPTTTDKIPVQSDDILDRRNELEGNVSLFQGLDQVEYLNYLFTQGAFKEEFLAEVDIREPIKIPKSFADDPDRPYHIPMIEMSEDLAKSLNYENKLDRCPENIKRLIEDGEKQGKQFLETRLSQMGLR
jgi:NTE family protein